MHTDLVIPNNNEESFIKAAEKLKYNEICFIYLLKNIKSMQKLHELQKKTKIKLNYGILCDYKSVSKAKNLSNLVIIDAAYLKNNIIRSIFENKNIDLIFNLEINNKKDHTHFLNSGLDQVLCKIAKKKNKIICFSFNQILNSSREARVRLLARIMQNIKFCKKYKVGIAITSFASRPDEMRYYHDLVAFLIALKAQPKDAKKALKIISKKMTFDFVHDIYYLQRKSQYLKILKR